LCLQRDPFDVLRDEVHLPRHIRAGILHNDQRVKDEII
jgi:hypothetical protein